MSTIKRFISPKRVNGLSEVFFRISVARGKVWRVRTGIYMDPARMRPDGTVAYPRANPRETAALRAVEQEIAAAEQAVFDLLLSMSAADVERRMVEEAIDRHRHPEKYAREAAGPRTFFELYDEFVEGRDIAGSSKSIYRSLGRCMHRFELYKRASGERSFRLCIDTIAAKDLADFERFYRDEWKICHRHPEFYEEYPAEIRPRHKVNMPARRGNNITVAMMKRLRTFFNWLADHEYTSNRPFTRYEGSLAERYGTPYYLTVEERDRIADFDLAGRPELAVQRDIFVFQCLIGCRVSDLRALMETNIVMGAVEYVAQKTSKKDGSVIRVPLSRKARQLVERYEGREDGRLFPFISDQRYNDAIKEVCRVCGIDRIVTVINPTTGRDERRPICEIASSHMARRTFIGNLYKRVKDAALVSSLSGHKEGSRAFARYRDIDDDMKRELIDLID